MDDDQQFCLRWNNHQSTLVSVFDTLLEKGMHVDCTLAAEGQTLKAHKVVLSACSPYFESVLSQQFDKHPIIILKDVKYAELRAMMDYMYRGEVNISQDQLAALLKAAESLQIKGLSDNKPSRPPSRPAQTNPPAHPPRATSPVTQTKTPFSNQTVLQQTRDESVDSREGSMSPSRRRKKQRRMSTESIPTTVMPLPIPMTNDTAQGNGDEPQMKEETQRDGVEDLTLDEEADDQPAVTHNDVVRNFQWHMERSQDEIMNSNDGVRESQGGKTTSIVTRSRNVCEEPPATVATFAVLKNVVSPARRGTGGGEDAKENKARGSPPPLLPAPAPRTSRPPPPRSARFNYLPPERGDRGERGDRAGPPAARADRTDRPDRPGYKPDKRYKCQNCSRCYNARKNLVRHVTLECGRDPQYKCPHCSYRKHRRNELKKHLEKKHPDHHGGLKAIPKL